MKLVTTGPSSGACLHELAGQYDEPGGVVLLVLDVTREDLEPVGLGCQGRRDGGLGEVARLRHLASGTGCVTGDHRPQTVLADHLAALPERVHVAVHGPDGLQGRAGQRHQGELDAQEVLADDVQVGVGQEVVDVGHPAGDRVVDRDHGQLGVATLDGSEHVLERGTGHRLPVGVVQLGHHVGVGARLALVGDASPSGAA